MFEIMTQCQIARCDIQMGERPACQSASMKLLWCLIEVLADDNLVIETSLHILFRVKRTDSNDSKPGASRQAGSTGEQCLLLCMNGEQTQC